MQLLDEIDFLADPRYESGYRYVYQRKSCWVVSFQHAHRVIIHGGFHRAAIAAGFIVNYFRERYGDVWTEWLTRKKERQLPDGVAGTGWQIREIYTNEWLLEVCPCGVWCTVEHYGTGRRSDIFPSQKAAREGLATLHRSVWPMFGPKILDSVPYRTPRHTVVIPANMG